MCPGNTLANRNFGARTGGFGSGARAGAFYGGGRAYNRPSDRGYSVPSSRAVHAQHGVNKFTVTEDEDGNVTIETSPDEVVTVRPSENGSLLVDITVPAVDVEEPAGPPAMPLPLD